MIAILVLSLAGAAAVVLAAHWVMARLAERYDEEQRDLDRVWRRHQREKDE